MNDRPTTPIAERLREHLDSVLARVGPALKAGALTLMIVPVLGIVLGVLATTVGVIGPPDAPSAASSVASPAATPATPAPAPDEPVESERPDRATHGPTGTRVHQVVAGDTLADLAQRYGVPVELIAHDSGVEDPHRIAVGTTLTLSVPPSDVEVIAAGTTLSDYAQRHHLSLAELGALNPQITDPDRIQAGAGLRVAVT